MFVVVLSWLEGVVQYFWLSLWFLTIRQTARSTQQYQNVHHTSGMCITIVPWQAYFYIVKTTIMIYFHSGIQKLKLYPSVVTPFPMLTSVIYYNCDVAFSPENRWANFFFTVDESEYWSIPLRNLDASGVVPVWHTLVCVLSYNLIFPDTHRLNEKCNNKSKNSELDLSNSCPGS